MDREIDKTYDQSLPEDDDNIVVFARARREGSHILTSFEGPSGSGKTYSSIVMGRGLVGPEGKLALLDTETGRGRTYAKLAGGFEYGELTPPFTPERYIKAIKCAERAGIQCLIIDSGSHEWEGIGGLLEIADSGKTNDGAELKGLAKWAKPKARHKKFVQTLLTTRMHLIICLRSREKLIQRRVNGKDEIVSAGWHPIQDKGLGFEMTARLFFPENSKGVPELLKCPEDLLGAFPPNATVSEQTGSRIAEWVRGGEPIDHEWLTLKREAEEAAEGGMKVLDVFWKRLDQPQRKMVFTIGANLRSIAEAADRESEEAANSDDDRLPSFTGTRP